MDQALWYPAGALRGARELENLFRIHLAAKEDLHIYTVEESYVINIDKMAGILKKVVLKGSQHTQFSDKNIYDHSAGPSQRVLNFHTFNILGCGQATPNFAFINYWHAYAYKLRIDNGPTALERMQGAENA
jgi:hypothetical protein